MLLSRAKPFAAMLLLFLTLPAAWATDLQRGLDAYQQGDYATALAQFEPLAEQGDPVAQFSLGVMYDNGEGVIQDYEQAFAWFRRAAEQGHARAQGHLGRMYFLGRGVEEDLVQAYIWFNLAVAQGDDRFGLSQKSRKLAEEKMTAEELEQAQEQSWDYMARYVEPFREGANGDTGTPPSTSPSEAPPTTVAATEPEAPPAPSQDSVSPPTPTVEAQIEPDTVAAEEDVPAETSPAQAPDSISTPQPIVISAVETPENIDSVPVDDVSALEPPDAPDPIDPSTRQETTLSKPSTPQTLSQPSPTVLSLPVSPFPQTDTPEPTAPTTTTTDAEQPPETTPQTAKVEQPEPAPTPRRASITSPVHPSPNGRFRVQLASLSSGEKAIAEGQRLQRHHPELLGHLEFSTPEAELEQGIFHRVQAGPLTYSQANNLCRTLKRQNQPCLVVNR